MIAKPLLLFQVRMDAYRGAILKNASLFNLAVVMDVGCGTGIFRWYPCSGNHIIFSSTPPFVLYTNINQEAIEDRMADRIEIQGE